MTSLAKLYKNLILLKVPNIYRAIQEIDRCCQGHTDVCNFYKNDPIQIGGSSIKIDFSNTTFKFYKIDNGNSITYNLFQDNNEENYPCIVIMIDKETKLASIQNLSYDDKCFSKDNVKHVEKSGSILLKLALDFVYKIQKHYDLKQLELTDNSMKMCSDINKPIQIWLISTLTCGDTWCGKYGFVPKDDMHKEYYRKNKIKMKTL